MTLGRKPDALFSEYQTLLTGDVVILARNPNDDYIRPADMRTHCHTLNTPAADADDLSEPNRFLYNEVVIDNNRWKLTKQDAFVQTNYNCYPTGDDFAATAHLELSGVNPNTSLPPTPPYLIEGIAFTYGCCIGCGLGYARWKQNNQNYYNRVKFAYYPNDLLVQTWNSNSLAAHISRQNGILTLLGELEVGHYRIPEPMAIRRITLEVHP